MDRSDRPESSAEATESLVALAAREALPEHQFIDIATVEWISENVGKIPPGPAKDIGSLPPVVQGILDNSPIPLHWHAEPRLAESIHGTRHLLRTAILSAILAHERGLDAARTQTLVLAAALHDCRRVHDNDDRGHGERGAIWFVDMVDEIVDFFGIRCKAHLTEAAIAIQLHERPYAKFTEDDQRARRSAEQVVDLLKTADALDRYRLPKLDWWPREKFLVVRPEPWLHQFAFSLVVDSERRYLQGATGAEAVRSALSGRVLP